jgi:DNA invertase Pin-like site-specific DNA recombinase
MTIYGYARVSADGQTPDAQTDRAKAIAALGARDELLVKCVPSRCGQIIAQNFNGFVL